MTESLAEALPPGATIGVLGGGQLGRMTAMAAAALGYRCHIYCPDADSPASQVTSRCTEAAYDDEAALAAFAAAVDVVTFEFENIPLATAEFLAERVPLRPKPNVLRICQNRLREKNFCRQNEVATAPYAAVGGLEELRAALQTIGRPAILKTAELGYDGKGQVRLDPETPLEAVWPQMATAAATTGVVLEGFVDFKMEVSVIVARDLKGARQTYVPVENKHKHHILDQTLVPARLPAQVGEKAEGIARHLAEAIDLIGVLAIEMFVTPDDRVLVNELAPRPHNSGHWTLDACTTSQFEQLVRAVAGLPLGATDRLADAVMQNLLGDAVATAQGALQDPKIKLHLYGKAEARPGRKMGHTTRLISRN